MLFVVDNNGVPSISRIIQVVEAVSIPADLDSDDDVDLVDFCLFAAQWRQADCGTCGGADLTGDGQVQLGDLAQFITYWLIGVE